MPSLRADQYRGSVFGNLGEREGHRRNRLDVASFFNSGQVDSRGMEIGVWRNNRSGLWFLDWYAANRCEMGDDLWDYCKHDSQRWSGRGVDLPVLFAGGAVFTPSWAELDAAYAENPNNAQLLLELAALTRGEWTGTVDAPLPQVDLAVVAQMEELRQRARC